jgi:hypothetical protein
MTVIRVEAQLTSDELVKAVAQLDAPELERFAAQIIALQARRKAPSCPRPRPSCSKGSTRVSPATCNDATAS